MEKVQQWTPWIPVDQLGILEDNPHLAAGCGWDKFHVLSPGTHWAAVDKLEVTDGYATQGKNV